MAPACVLSRLYNPSTSPPTITSHTQTMQAISGEEINGKDQHRKISSTCRDTHGSRRRKRSHVEHTHARSSASHPHKNHTQGTSWPQPSSQPLLATAISHLTNRHGIDKSVSSPLLTVLSHACFSSPGAVALLPGVRGAGLDRYASRLDLTLRLQHSRSHTLEAL